VGGHLFSYNEIKDYKKNLSCIRKKAQNTIDQRQDNLGKFEVSSGLVIQNLAVASPSERKFKSYLKFVNI
jgi:hypothetical protein